MYKMTSKHIPKSGSWRQQPDGLVMWRERLDTFGTEVKLYKPTELQGIERSASFKLVFLKEIADPENSLSGSKKIWFAQDVEVRINDNVSDNIVLRWESGSKKWYLSDLTMLGTTEVCPLESDSVITVTKSDAYRVTTEQAQEILKTHGWGFGKVSVSANGEIEYFRTV